MCRWRALKANDLRRVVDLQEQNLDLGSIFSTVDKTWIWLVILKLIRMLREKLREHFRVSNVNEIALKSALINIRQSLIRLALIYKWE